MLAHHLTPVLAEALAHILFPKGIPAHSEPHAALRGHPKAAGRDPSTPALLP